MTQGQETGERLARYLAHAGIASRRHVEELIAAGRVQVKVKVLAAAAPLFSLPAAAKTKEGSLTCWPM